MTRRPFRRAGGDARRGALIGATLDCIAERGLPGTTVREVAERAGVTNGLIRHYFETKDHMIHEAYRAMIGDMTEMAKAAVADIHHAPRMRLRLFVEANLTAPVVDLRTLSLWASFVSMIRVDPAMEAIHREGYLIFRHEVETLVCDLFAAEKRDLSPGEAQALATKINAIIDGLWLEGCMAADMFDGDRLVALGVEAVEATIGLKLEDED